jgi:hypothetical protein
VNRKCATCKHWEVSKRLDDSGTCRAIDQDSDKSLARLGTDPMSGCFLITRAEFFCALWEAKEPEKQKP